MGQAMKKVKYTKWSVEHGLSAIKKNLLRYLAERTREPSKIFHVLLPHTVDSVLALCKHCADFPDIIVSYPLKMINCAFCHVHSNDDVTRGFRICLKPEGFQ